MPFDRRRGRTDRAILGALRTAVITFVVDYASRLMHPAIQSLLLGTLALLLVSRRRPRAGLVTGTLALAWVWLASCPGLALALRDGLLPATPPRPARIGAIVVLGGGRLPHDGSLPDDTRAGTALRWWRGGLAPVLMASGRDQADDLARRYRDAGVPRERLRVEHASTDTHENARDSATLLRAEGIRTVAVVTSPVHLRRAAACFRHEGLAVWPIAASDDDEAALRRAPAWLPRRDALTLTARSLHEYVATWIYRRRGWM